MEKSKSLTTSPEISPDIAELCQKVERWRQTRQQMEPMPKQLWARATELARQHGVARIAGIARLDYYRLKKRCGTFDQNAAPKQEERPSFVELPLSLSPTAECIVELEDRRGGYMRIHLKGGQTPDLAALSRTFWSRES